MQNPWTKKNPFMSMWLSNANRIGGAARARMTAAARRQASKAMKEGAGQVSAFWLESMTGKPVKRRKPR